MDSIITAITIVSIIVSPALALLGLWVRLCGRARYEQARCQNLTKLAKTVSLDGQLEFDEQGDGRHIRLKITRKSTSKDR